MNPTPRVQPLERRNRLRIGHNEQHHDDITDSLNPPLKGGPMNRRPRYANHAVEDVGEYGSIQSKETYCPMTSLEQGNDTSKDECLKNGRVHRTPVKCRCEIASTPPIPNQLDTALDPAIPIQMTGSHKAAEFRTDLSRLRKKRPSTPAVQIESASVAPIGCSLEIPFLVSRDHALCVFEFIRRLQNLATFAGSLSRKYGSI